jgi:4-carboxymuconolactone decarboxylase
MSAQTETLGGRLPLLDPSTLSPAQKETYEHLNKTWIPWANGVPFQSKLEDGRLIGPFNPILFSPAISSSFLALRPSITVFTRAPRRTGERTLTNKQILDKYRKV